MGKEGVKPHGVTLGEEEKNEPTCAGKRCREEEGSNMETKGGSTGRYGGPPEEVMPKAKRERWTDIHGTRFIVLGTVITSGGDHSSKDIIPCYLYQFT